jgi:hypothetical protein
VVYMHYLFNLKIWDSSFALPWNEKGTNLEVEEGVHIFQELVFMCSQVNQSFCKSETGINSGDAISTKRAQTSSHVKY